MLHYSGLHVGVCVIRRSLYIFYDAATAALAIADDWNGRQFCSSWRQVDNNNNNKNLKKNKNKIKNNNNNNDKEADKLLETALVMLDAAKLFVS